MVEQTELNRLCSFLAEQGGDCEFIDKQKESIGIITGKYGKPTRVFAAGEYVMLSGFAGHPDFAVEYDSGGEQTELRGWLVLDKIMNEEKEIVLDIRFTVGTNCISAELLRREEFIDGFSRINNTEPKNSPFNFLVKLFELNAQIESYSNSSEKKSHWLKLKTWLNLFAVSNTEEKPVPRLERNERLEGFNLYVADNSIFLTQEQFAALQSISRYSIPIYDLKPLMPMFTSEWIQEMPRELKAKDIPPGQAIPILSEIGDPFALGKMPLDDVITWTIDQCNKLNAQSPVEVHRFVMRKI